ncbi:MAG: hypothetical protein EZS28_039764, partial [Streblomastix strix]
MSYEPTPPGSASQDKRPSPSETLASPLYFEIAKWAAGTGCSVELPIPMG